MLKPIWYYSVIGVTSFVQHSCKKFLLIINMRLSDISNFIIVIIITITTIVGVTAVTCGISYIIIVGLVIIPPVAVIL